jgi:YgiT-type zinc finger domain-containing protein
MSRYECSNCGEPASITRGDYDFVESGLDYVVLHNAQIIECTHCGNRDPVIHKPKMLMNNLLVAVAGKPERLEGQDVRFIRKQLRMTQETFARFVATDKTKISKWENDADPIGPQSDLLIRSVAVSLSDEVSKQLARKVVEGFQNIAAEHAVKELCVDAENDYRIETVA